MNKPLARNGYCQLYSWLDSNGCTFFALESDGNIFESRREYVTGNDRVDLIDWEGGDWVPSEVDMARLFVQCKYLGTLKSPVPIGVVAVIGYKGKVPSGEGA